MTFLDLASRGKNAWWRYGLSIVLATILMIVIITCAALPVGLLRLMPRDLAAQMMSPSHPLLFFSANGAAFAALLAGFVVAIRVVQRKRFADLVGLWRWQSVGLGFGLWTAALILNAVLDLLLVPSGFAVSANAQTPTLALVVLPVLAVQTFAEEFIFRGLITQGLLLATRRPAATAILSGLVFGLMHIPNGAPQAAGAAVFGVALALIAIRTGSLAFGFGLHLANNLFAAVILVSATDIFKGAPGLFTQSTPGLTWVDFAFNAVALAVATRFMLKRPAA
jgi:membrane protease YdiL (CAAX protease family)